MNLLIVAATKFEIAPFLKNLALNSYPVDILISGVGMVPTAFALGKKLSEKKYDALLNIGIAGSFDKKIALGSIVRVQNDTFSELGAHNDQNFLTIDEMGFGESTYNENALPFLQHSCVSILKTVSGITVNTVHGNQISINEITDRLNPEIESMEGAAVFYAAKLLNLYSLQIRSISNFVEKRDQSAWQMDLAIKNLNDWLIKFTQDLFPDWVNPKDL